MKNLKKEYKFSLAILSILFIGWILNNVLVSSKQDDTKKIAEEVEERKSQLLRDESIQQKVNLSRELYSSNIKSNENFTIVTTVFMEKIQDLLSTSAIKYNPNDFQQINTSEVVEGNLALYTFDLSFTTDYNSFLQFLKNLEKDKLFFDVVDLKVTIVKEEIKYAPAVEGVAPQPLPSNSKPLIKAAMRIQITKFV